MNTARIGAADFVTPPEFRGLELDFHSGGQVGGVRVELIASEGQTRLGACYQQPPLRTLPPFHFAGEPAALLYLVNVAPGLMDGDGHRIDVTVGPGARAVVTGQSATRVHPAVSRFATQQWQVRVADGGQLVILPGPAIPFAGCRYYQRVRVELAGDARFLWGDVWLPGRYARTEPPERFQFAHIIQDLEIRRDGRLVFRDRFSWQGPWDAEAIRWHFGEHAAAAGLFLTGVGQALTPARDADRERVILPLASGDTLVRWCGAPAAVTRELVATALGQAACGSGGAPDVPWLLHSNHLGPNHWFSPPGP